MTLHKIIVSAVAALIAFSTLQPMIEGVTKEAAKTSSTISAEMNRALKGK